MAQEVRLQGRTYSDVPSILLPDSNNVFHPFTDVSDTTATAADVATGKYFYLADGTKTQGTSSGGGGRGAVTQDQDGYLVLDDDAPAPSITVESLSVTQNGTYTAPTGKAYSPVTVSVGGGGIGTLIATQSLGEISTTDTNEVNTGQTISVSDINAYDYLIVVCAVGTPANDHHVATISVIALYNASGDTTTSKTSRTIPSTKIVYRMSSVGQVQSAHYSGGYGVYRYSCTLSNGNASIAIYTRYQSTNTLTIDGNYTAKVYGLNIADTFLP